MSRRAPWLIGAGVGAVALGGAIYLIWKYTEDEDDEKLGRTFTRTHTSSRPVAIEVKIPRDQVGAIIGRGGDNVKEIQRKTNTRIDFKDDLDDDNVRVAVIRGTPDEAQLAEILIHQILANQPRLETLELMIPQCSVGRVIGRNGETIRDIQFRSKCKVDVERGGSGSDFAIPKRVTLRGTSEQITHAKQLIEEKVQEDNQLRQKIELSTQSRSQRSHHVAPLFLTAENPNENGNTDDLDNQLHPPRHESLKANSGGFDDVIEVYVSSIADPGLFYVQKVGPGSIELDKLTEAMTAFYEIEESREAVLPSEVKIGDLVAAHYLSDNRWYRARIVEIITDDYDESNTEVDIDFVDYGDCQRMKLTEVFQLEKEFLKLNFQAVECSMANIKPVNGSEWRDEASDDFERLTHAAHWKPLLARLVRFETKNSNDTNPTSRPCIELVDANTSQDINIGAEMVRLGHAVFVDSLGSTVQSPISGNSTAAESPSTYVDAAESFA